jgi:hypothetical protein
MPMLGGPLSIERQREAAALSTPEARAAQERMQRQIAADLAKVRRDDEAPKVPAHEP